MRQEKRSGKIENKHTIQLEPITGTGTLGDLGLGKILTENFMNWTQRVKIPVAFRSVNYKLSLRNIRSLIETNM